MSSWGRSYLPIKSVFDFMAPPATLTVVSTHGIHSIPTTGRSKAATCVLEHSVGATRRVEREFLDVLDWGLSVAGTDVVKYYHHISAFSLKPETVPVPVLPPALDDVEMDAYPWEISDGFPLSSYSPQILAAVVLPSNQPTRVHLPSNEKLRISATVKQASDPSQKRTSIRVAIRSPVFSTPAPISPTSRYK